MPTPYRLPLVLALALAGSATARAQPATLPGTVFVVGGVGGYDPLPHCTDFVLPRAGVPHQVENFFWNHGIARPFCDLMDTPHLIQKADELAALILARKAQQPDRPIYLIAKSGGTGLALLAAERLPPGTLERLILLSAAVSPEFDLRPALRATRRELVSFYSNRDRVILGIGTSLFGTIDRVYGPSAGKVGFAYPPAGDADGQLLYRRLVQIHWRPAMLLQGYGGMHTGNSLPPFLMAYVVPWLR